jgi:hypothetical protein
MNGSDREKLIKANFRVMRVGVDKKTITELNTKGHWNLLSRYETQKELNEAVKSYRLNEDTIFESE